MSEKISHNQLLDMVDDVQPDSDQVKREKEAAAERERSEKYIGDKFKRLRRIYEIDSMYGAVPEDRQTGRTHYVPYHDSKGTTLEVGALDVQTKKGIGKYAPVERKFQIMGRMVGGEGKTTNPFVVYEFFPQNNSVKRGFGDGDQRFDLHDPANAHQKQEMIDMLDTLDQTATEAVKAKYEDLHIQLSAKESELIETEEKNAFSDKEKALYKNISGVFKGELLTDELPEDSTYAEQENTRAREVRLEAMITNVSTDPYITRLIDNSRALGIDITTGEGLKQVKDLYKKMRPVNNEIKAIESAIEEIKGKIINPKQLRFIEKKETKPEQVTS